jgi:hypothetical protein
VVVPAQAQALLTRGDLRWRIANRLGGSEEWAWRSVAAPGATQIVAPLLDLVVGGLNEQRGLWAYFPDGANAGLERRVVAFRPWDPGDPDTVPPVLEELPMVEWAPSLPVPVAMGDRIDLSVLRPSRINDAIDDALRLMAEPTALPAQIVLVTDGLSDTLTLPDSAVSVADCTWLGEGDVVVNGTDDETRSLLPRGSWEMVPGRGLRVGSVSVWGPWGWNLGLPPAGWRLLVDYRQAVPLPTSDDDLVPCLPQAVVSSACADLAMGMQEMRPLLPLLLDQAQRDRSRASRHDFGALRPVMP